MLVDMGGSSAPSSPPPPPSANDVATATADLQAKLGDASQASSEAAYEARLQAAIKAIEDANAQANRQALAEAAILLQQRRDAQAKQVNAAGVNSLTEATSEVGLTHQFDDSTLAAASKALGGSSLTVDPSSKSSPVSLASALAEISSDQKSGMTLQEAVNAARVAFGGGAQNEVVLNEAAIVATGTPLASDPARKGGATVLTASAQTVAGQHLFTSDTGAAALKALTVDVKATPQLTADARRAQSAYAALQKDKSAHASAAQISQDEATYHQALSDEYNAAAGEPNDDWRSNATQIDRSWQAQQTVLDLNTGEGLSSAPSRADLMGSLSAAQILDDAQSARGSGDAAGNLKAAQALTQQLQGVSSDSPLYREVMGDARTQALQTAALHDILSAHGSNANDTLVAVSKALAGYRNTVLYQGANGSGLADAVLHDPGVAKTIDAVQAPAKLPDIAKLLEQVSSGSPQLAQALYTQRLAQPLKALIAQGDGMASLTGQDTFFGPAAQAVQALDPKSAAGQDLLSALNAELGKLAKLPRTSPTGPSTRFAGPSSQPFDSLSLTTTDGTPMRVYQTLLDQDAKNAPLAQLIETDTGLSPSSAAPGSAPQDAAQLSTAMSALSDASAKSKSPADILAAAKKAQPLVSDATWAQAMILRGAVADGQKWTSDNAAAIKAGNAPTPADMISQASGELGGQHLFDANTIASATASLQNGTVYAVPSASTPKGSSQVDPLAELKQYQSMGISLPAAVVMVRQEMGGSAANEPVIMQAAVTLAAEQFSTDPTQADPIAAGLQALQKSAPNLFSKDEQGALDAVAKSMEQDPKVDQKALDAAIAKAQQDQQTLDKANQRVKQNPNDASAKQAAAAAQAAYQADLTAALNLAGGHKADDSGWQAQATNVDSLWKAQFTVAEQMLAPQIQAAQGTDKDSEENKALDAAFGDLQTSLQAVQIVQQALYEQKSKADGGAGGGNAAAAQLLTSELGDLQPGNALYDQVMNSDGITALQKSIQQDVLGGMPLVCTSNDDTKKELVALGNRLSVYQGTVFYQGLLKDAVGSTQTQSLFDSVAMQVDSKSKPLDRLKALASATQGLNPDLAAALDRSKFGGNDKSRPGGDILQWLKQDGTTSSLQPVAQIYANLGSNQNPDLTPIRQWLEQAMTKSSGDGGIADLHTTAGGGRFGWETGKSNTTLVYGLDSLKSQTDKSQMQLFQDILDDHGVSPAVTKEITNETGYKAAGSTPAALTADANGNLYGLAAVDGVHDVTSFNKAVDAIGQMEGATPAHVAQSLDDVRADELGTRSLYDPNTKVYTAGGKSTTIGDMARQLMSGEGITQISGIDPLMLTSLALSYQAKDGSSWQGALIEGIGPDGNYVDVGPADTKARHGLSDWYKHTGFAKGQVQVQPHWVLGADGQQLLGDAYLDTHRTGVYHWYDWDNIQAGLMVVAAIVTVAAMPEAAPLWLEGLSLVLDGYFAVSSGIQAQQAFAHHDAKQGWMDVAFAAAGVFGGVLSGAKMVSRLGVGSTRFAEASGLAKLAEQGKDVKAYKNASIAPWLDDSRLGQWAMPKLASGVRLANRIQGPLRFVDAGGQRAFNTLGLAHRALSFTSMGIGLVQMGDQSITLLRDRDKATSEDWLQFFTGMTAMAIGTAGARVHAARSNSEENGGAAAPATAATQSQTQSEHQQPPIVLSAANLEASSLGGAAGGTSPSRKARAAIALATFKLALAHKAAQTAAAARAAAATVGNRVVNAASQAGKPQEGNDEGGTGTNAGAAQAPAPALAPSPSESLDALLDRLLRTGARSSNDVYTLYSKGDAPARTPLTAAQARLYVEKIRALTEDRPEGSSEVNQSPQGPLAPFLDANPDGGRTFYHFLPPGDISPADEEVEERIYINAVPEHAADVMTFLVKNVLDDHQSHPGIHSMKATSPSLAHGRVDNLVIYPKDSAVADRVIDALRNYQQANPGHFDPAVPPMTRGVLPGVSVGAEVTPEMGPVSFGQVRSEAIWRAFEETRREQDRCSEQGLPFDAATFLREKARAQLAAAGVDPNDPSRNLPSAGAGKQPAAPTHKPAAPAQKQAAPAQKPAAPAQKPAGSAQKPAGAKQKPAGAKQKPAGSAQKPAGAKQKPAGSKQKPATPPQGPASPPPPQQPPVPPSGGAPLPPRSDGESITDAVDNEELVYEHAKPGGHWVGAIVRDTSGKFGAKGGLVLLKQFWGEGEPPALSENRARNAVTTSQLMRKMFGEGSAVPVHLVHWDIGGERYYGVAMPYLNIDVLDKGSYRILTDPTQGEATGVYATAAGHIALNNTAVAGVAQTGKGPRLGNVGLGAGPKGKKSALFLDLDSTMRVDSEGNARPFDPLSVSDVPSALDTLRNADDSAPLYGYMTNQQYFAGVDRLREYMAYHHLDDDIRAIVDEHGAGTQGERARDADTIIANIQAQIAFRESVLGPYTGAGSRPLAAATLPAGFRTTPLQETGTRLRNPLLNNSTITGRRKVLHAANNLQLFAHRLRRSTRHETHVWPNVDPDLTTLVPPAKPALPSNGSVIDASNTQFSPSTMSGLGLTFGVMDGTPRRGLSNYLDPSAALSSDDIAQWDPQTASGQASAQQSGSSGVLAAARKKLSGMRSGALGSVKDPSKERLYVYAQDGGGLPLGYYDRSEDGAKLTWYSASHRTRAQKVHAAAIGGSTFVFALGVGTAARVTGIMSHAPLLSPLLSTIRSAIGLGKVANESRQQVFNEISDGRLEQATELINRRHSLAQRALKKLKVPPHVRARVQAHTATLLGELQRIESGAWDSHKPETTLSDALANYNEMIKHETGYKFSELEAMNTGRLKGKLLRLGGPTTFGGSGAKYETKLEDFSLGSGLEAASNLLGATASVADSSVALATSVTGSRPNAVSKFSGKASKFLVPINTYGFAAGYAMDAWVGAHNTFMLSADLAAAAAGVAARRYAVFMQRIDDKILVYRPGAKGELIGYATYTGDGRLKWYERNGAGGYHEVKNMSTTDLDDALTAKAVQAGDDPTKLRFIVTRKSPEEVNDELLSTAKQTTKATAGAKRKPVQLSSMADVTTRVRRHGQYQKAASFAFWAVGAALVSTVLSTVASTFFNSAPAAQRTNATPTGDDKKKKKAPAGDGTSSAPTGGPPETPKPKQTSPTSEPWRVVVVKRGDTLWGIAADNNDTIEQIEPLNPEFDWALLDSSPFTAPPPGAGRNPNLIFPGDRVKVTQP
jgi:LysM repeat protein